MGETVLKLEDGGQSKQNAALPWEKSNHPLYLHHTDQLGAVLITQTLEEDNYTHWAQAMIMALTIKNKKGFVDGKVKRPEHNEDEQEQWDRFDTLVKTWLLGSMSKEISGSVMHCSTANGMWMELKERFSHTNIVQLFQIESSIHNCEQGSGSVTAFFTKLKALWDEKDSLCAFPACTSETATEIKAYLENQRP